MKPGTADLFMRILDRCKSEVTLTYNPHKPSYESVESFMESFDRYKDVEMEVLAFMREKDTIFQLQMYPDNSVGSYTVYHHDIDSLMVEAADCLKLQ